MKLGTETRIQNSDENSATGTVFQTVIITETRLQMRFENRTGKGEGCLLRRWGWVLLMRRGEGDWEMGGDAAGMGEWEMIDGERQIHSVASCRGGELVVVAGRGMGMGTRARDWDGARWTLAGKNFDVSFARQQTVTFFWSVDISERARRTFWQRDCLERAVLGS